MEDQQEKLIYYLGELNKHWQQFDKIENGQIAFFTKFEKLKAQHHAEESYVYAELKLAEFGWRWEQLHKVSKTFSFPEGVTHE